MVYLPPQATVLDVVAEIERALPLLGLQAPQLEWLTMRLNSLRSVAPAPTPAPAPAPDWAQNNQNALWGVGTGWEVSMQGTGWPNAWVPNVNGAPDWSAVVAEGNTSGPNSGIEGLAAAQMPPDQLAAYVAAIKATGAQF